MPEQVTGKGSSPEYTASKEAFVPFITRYNLETRSPEEMTQIREELAERIKVEKEGRIQRNGSNQGWGHAVFNNFRTSFPPGSPEMNMANFRTFPPSMLEGKTFESISGPNEANLASKNYLKLDIPAFFSMIDTALSVHNIPAEDVVHLQKGIIEANKAHDHSAADNHIDDLYGRTLPVYLTLRQWFNDFDLTH